MILHYIFEKVSYISGNVTVIFFTMHVFFYVGVCKSVIVNVIYSYYEFKRSNQLSRSTHKYTYGHTQTYIYNFQIYVSPIYVFKIFQSFYYFRDFSIFNDYSNMHSLCQSVH